MSGVEGMLPVTVPNRRVRATYDRVAGLYAHTIARFEAPSQRRAVAELDLSPGDTVVDIGCGPGRVLPALADRVGPTGEVLGVDAAPSMLAQARRRAGRTGVTGRLSLTLGDARRLPVADGAVDAVCVFDVLDLFTRGDLERVLDECHRVLTPEGRLCVVTMDRASIADSTFLRAYEWAYRRVPRFETVGCRPIPATAVLQGADFAVQSVTRLRRGGIWPVGVFVCTPAGAADNPTG